jgi:hypothetical protein
MRGGFCGIGRDSARNWERSEAMSGARARKREQRKEGASVRVRGWGMFCVA